MMTTETVALSLLRHLLGITAFMLVLCGMICWLARRPNHGVPSTPSLASVRLLHRMPLDRHRSICLFAIGHRTLAVCLGERVIESISLVDDGFSRMLEESLRSSQSGQTRQNTSNSSTLSNAGK